MRRAIGAFVWVLVCAVSARGATIIVLADGSGDQPTLQAAVDAAQAGDEILLGDGTFVGEGNRDIDFGGKAITLRSQGGDPEACVIDCQGSASNPHRAFRFASGETAATLVSDLTLANGAAWRADTGAPVADARGGGIYCSESSPTLRNCRIVDCAAEYEGGGIYITGGAPSLEACVFARNTGSTGGGVYGRGDQTTLASCSFDENTAANGGAAGWRESSAQVTDCTFTSNAATVTGGAVSANTVSDLQVADCVLDGNSAAYGGALSCFGGGAPTFDACTISANAATGTGAWPEGVGGGLFTDVFTSPTLTGCEFTGNDAALDGGGCFANGVDIVFTDCAFTTNSAAGSGGGLYADSDSPSLSGCVLVGNIAVEHGGGALFYGGVCAVTQSTFDGNTAADGGGLACLEGHVNLTSCTFNTNQGATGAGIHVGTDGALTADRALLVFGTTGAAVSCDGCDAITLSCSDLYGNEGGDYEGTDVADQEGLAGNIRLDPEFCHSDPAGHDDWSIEEDSPCAEEQSDCGLIGGWDTGCTGTPVYEVTWGTIKARYR